MAEDGGVSKPYSPNNSTTTATEPSRRGPAASPTTFAGSVFRRIALAGAGSSRRAPFTLGVTGALFAAWSSYSSTFATGRNGLTSRSNYYEVQHTTDVTAMTATTAGANLVHFKPSSSKGAERTTRSCAFLPPEKQRELGAMWGRAIQAVAVPNPQGETEDVFLQAEKYASKESAKEIPTVLKEGVWYLISGYNPMGETRAEHENRAANAALRRRLDEEFESSDPNKPRVLAAYGTDEEASWREDGFAVKVYREPVGQEESAILALGREFGQVALYRYEWMAEPFPGRLSMRIVACFPEMKGVETEENSVRINVHA